MRAIYAALEKEVPDRNAGRTVMLFRLSDQMVGEIRPALFTLAGAVGARSPGCLRQRCQSRCSRAAPRADERSGCVLRLAPVGAGWCARCSPRVWCWRQRGVSRALAWLASFTKD